MSTQVIKVKAGDTLQLNILMTSGGAGISGQAPTVEIRRLRDGRYFDFAAVAAPYWKTTLPASSGILTEKVWGVGLYMRNWDQAVFDESNAEKYTMIYRNGNSQYPVYVMEFYHFESPEVESILNAILNDYLGVEGSVAESLAIIRGLTQSNFILDNTVHNSGGLLTDGRIRIFSEAAKLPVDSGGSESDGLIAAFQVTTVSDDSSDVLVKSYRVQRIS